MDIFSGREPIEVDRVYAYANHPHNIFGEALYHNESRLWAHKNIAAITLLAARILYQKTNYRFSVKDCLRTTDAQAAMGKTQIVKDNPDWLEEPNRMVSTPGNGAHPRGMAIDVCVIDADGREIDMGTSFDEMDPKSYRNCNHLPAEVIQNRKSLEDSFMASAKALGFDFLPLPSEWWDFRFPTNVYRQYEPLSDKDLPQQMQMTNKVENNIPDFEDTHFQSLADDIIALINQY
jgi:D-alanyl-D-alanine dipeptidase